MLIYIARSLEVAEYGKFAFAYALMNLFWILGRFGLELLISRDVAQDVRRAPRYLGDTLQLHAYLGGLALILMACTLLALQKSAQTSLLALLLGLAMIINSMTESFSFTFASQGRFGYQSMLMAGSQVLTLALVFVSLANGWGLSGIGLGFIGAAVVYFLASWFFCAREIASPALVWDGRQLWGLLRKAVPFAAAGLFVSIYYRIDVVILSAVKTDQMVGWYDAAYNFVWVLKLVPISLATVLLPLLSRLYLTDQEKTTILYRKIIKYSVLIAIPLVFTVFIWAGKLVALVYGDHYFEAGLVLRWLVWTTLLMFVNAHQGNILIAAGREKRLLIATAVGAGSNVILNLILIPPFGFYGAAVTTILSELVVAIMCASYSRPFLAWQNILNDILKPLLLLLIMVIIWAILDLNVITSTIVILSLYGLALMVFSLVPSNDLKLLKMAFKLNA